MASGRRLRRLQKHPLDDADRLLLKSKVVLVLPKVKISRWKASLALVQKEYRSFKLTPKKSLNPLEINILHRLTVCKYSNRLKIVIITIFLTISFSSRSARTR